MSLSPDDPRHGTPNGYGNYRCRCDHCRAAWMAYMRERGLGGYAKNDCACGQPKHVASKQCQACDNAARSAQHGTESRYRNGCRCGGCRDAAREAKRVRRERSRVPCSHGCGRLVDGINRRTPDKPPECQPCAMRRIGSEKRAAV